MSNYVIPDEFTCYAIGDNGNKYPPPTMIRFITCTQDRTRVHVYNYSYWRCGYCGGDTGGGPHYDAPPHIQCRECKQYLYTDDPEKAMAMIRVTRGQNNMGYGFDKYVQFRTSRRWEYSWDWYQDFRKKLAQRPADETLCVGESR